MAMPCSVRCHVCPSTAGMCPGTRPVYLGHHPSAIQWPDVPQPHHRSSDPSKLWVRKVGDDLGRFGDPWLPPTPRTLRWQPPILRREAPESTNRGIERGCEMWQCLCGTEGLPAPRSSWDSSQGRNK